MAVTILLTQPVYGEILKTSKTLDSELEKSDTGDLHREIKKENESPASDSIILSHADKKSSFQAEKKVRPSKSFNHNFQKHAVITIKKLGRKMCQNLGNSPAQDLATRMWNIFQSCGIASKKILVVLFGEANFSCEKSKELFRSCLFGEICGEAEETVRSAQNILRERLLELTGADFIRSHIFRSRKICQREEFIAYFSQFIEMLRSGPLTKFRLNAQATHHI